MDKSLVAAVVIICWAIVANMPISTASSQTPEGDEKWIENLSQKKEKTTKLHFYFHRIGPKTGVVVAQANMTTPTSFGLVVIKDDPLTLGPELSSTHIGYAQGLSASASLEDVVLHESFAFVFTDGAHNGSTLAVLGSNPILHQYREMPIVGGTGFFRLATGVVSYQTVFYNTTSGDSSVEVDLVAFHF